MFLAYLTVTDDRVISAEGRSRMTAMEEARAKRDAKLDELHEKLTGAVETLVSGADWARALDLGSADELRAEGANCVFG